jgi:predicted DNA-binding mobile mystery protein A
MNDATRHLDQRFQEFRTLNDLASPPKGWIRAIRDALGMTTAQYAKRLGVSQPRVVAIEKAEANKAITLKSLERAAEALNCRVVYFFVPETSLEDTVQSQADFVAARQLTALNQTMHLEDQSVHDMEARKAMRDNLVRELIKHPTRLWDDKW